MISPTVYISGCHAGPNPSPGVGVARSLRSAYPHARLIAKDHSLQCSGLHVSVFDDLWICRPWNELDLDTHRRQIKQRLGEDALYLPGLDLEVRWLAEAPPAGALVPPSASLHATAKPDFPAAQRLPIQVPAWISFSESPRAVHAFCRAHDWRVWVKGSAYEAHRAENWNEVLQAARRLEETWGTTDIHIQEEIRGWEVSIVFAAHKGRLLDALFMEKRLLTETGKTWAGALSDLAPSWTEALRAVVAELEWTGGSELEFVRDANGQLWLMDWNPRFPAWVHGVTFAGRNLPGMLVEAASGKRAQPSQHRSSHFTRVVAEIPVREGFPLPSPPPEKLDRVKGGKHPSGMPLMMRRMAESPRQPRPILAESVGEPLAGDIRLAVSEPNPTPYRFVLPETARKGFRWIASLQERRFHSGVRLRVAYSCKTNPSAELLRLALDNGMWVEVISGQELEWVLKNGFEGEKILYNGPLPYSPETQGDSPRLRALFADSVEAFQKYKQYENVETIGARLRPAFVDSRFGIEMEDYDEFAALRAAIDTLPVGRTLGLSFHIQSSRVGLGRWYSLLPGLLEQAAAFQDLTGRAVQVADLGGGHDAGDSETYFSAGFARIVRELKRRLPSLTDCIVEPGKALAEPCGAVVSTLVELRKRGAGHREAVVDASIAELPLIDAFPHRVMAVSADRMEMLPVGDDAILGRLCMEGDVLMPRVKLPFWLREGDRIVVLDCGAYDASMTYPFGKGDSFERHSDLALRT